MNELTKKVLFDDLYCNTRYSIDPPEGIEQYAVIWRDGEAKVIYAEEFITWQDEIENEDAALIQMLQKAVELNPSNVSSEINRAMCILEEHEKRCVRIVTHPSCGYKAYHLGMEVLTSEECPENSEFILPPAMFLGVRCHDGNGKVDLAILNPHLVVELKYST